MASRIQGITIEIDGDSSRFQKAIKDIDKSLKATQTTLKDIDKLLKLDPKNTELLTQKQKNLESAIKQTKDRLKELKAAQDGVEKSSAEWDALQREIIDTEQKLDSLKKEYKDFGSVAKQQIKATGEQMKALGDKIAGIGDKLTMRVTAPIVGAFTLAANSASDFEENVNKINVAFGESADDVLNWAKTASTQFGLSQVAATQAASGFGALGKGIGLSEETAASMSTTLTGLSADLASYFNTSSEDAASALEGIFTGQSKALTQFGVIMNETNLKAFAEDMGLVYSEMDQGEKTMLRYNFVLNATKDAQGDYARSSSGTANTIKTFQASLQDLATVIGQQLLPIITPIIQKFTEIIQKISNLPEPVQKMIVEIGLVVAALGPVLAIGGRLISGFGSFLTAISALFSPMGLAVAAVAALVAVGILLYKNWDKITAWWKDNVVAKFKQGGAELRQDWENIKTTAINLWSGMQTGWSTVKSGVSSAMDQLKSTVSEKWESIKSTFSASIESIKGMFNFSWSLPHINLPHFSVQGGKSPYGLGGQGYLPSIRVDWYKKAYENAVMFTSPTVLQTPGGYKGFGDGHGAEIVLGLEKLRQLVGTTSGVVINVYSTPGQNVDELADKIQQRFVALQKQREAAYA
jgi:phage-related minor tail protein